MSIASSDEIRLKSDESQPQRLRPAANVHWQALVPYMDILLSIFVEHLSSFHHNQSCKQGALTIFKKPMEENARNELLLMASILKATSTYVRACQTTLEQSHIHMSMKRLREVVLDKTLSSPLFTDTMQAMMEYMRLYGPCKHSMHFCPVFVTTQTLDHAQALVTCSTLISCYVDLLQSFLEYKTYVNLASV